MKKFCRNRHRLNVLIFVLAVMFFVLPTVVTLRLMDRKTEEDKKYDSMVYGIQKTSEGVPGETLTVSPLLEVEEPLKLEKDTTHRNILMMSTEQSDDNNLAASASDAEKVKDNKEVQNGSENAENIEKNKSLEKIVVDKSAGDKNSVSTDESTKISTDTSSDTDAQNLADKYKDIPLNGRKVYLTFDDGPSCYTEDLLKVLKDYDVKATFFVVAGSKDYEEQLKEIAADGHAIGLHSYTHVYKEIYKDIKSFKNDVKNVHDWVRNVTGIDSRIYRFPGGSANSPTGLDTALCVEYLEKEGYQYYDWNSLSGDAEGTEYSEEQMVENVMVDIRKNDLNDQDSIVLLHDHCSNHETVEMLPELIETLKSEGYELCAIDKNAPHAKQFIPEEEANQKASADISE